MGGVKFNFQSKKMSKSKGRHSKYARRTRKGGRLIKCAEPPCFRRNSKKRK